MGARADGGTAYGALALLSVAATTALLVGAALTGCAAIDTALDAAAAPEAVTATARATATDSTTLTAAAATAALAALSDTARRTPSVTGYQRRAFGTAWSDVDRNGCNQRDDVLRRDAVAGTLVVGHQGRCDHDVLAGTWIDPYSGRRLELDDLKDRSQAQAIQIDHVVPLAEAWVSGASSWSPERRRLFANDLGVLLAVDGPTNTGKGSGDPAAWRPRKGYQCEYARRWIQVKAEWALGVDASERAALASMLGTC